jgi:hypothetical protein
VDRLPWHPIEELKDKYQAELLLRAPELVDLDCNSLGVGLGYWQDGAGDSPHSREVRGCFLACKWNMSVDEWFEVECHPTHFIVLGNLGKEEHVYGAEVHLP